jgi:hypothetical protein
MVSNFQPLDGLKKALVVGIGAVMVVELLAIYVEANLIKVTSAIAAGTAGPQDAIAHDEMSMPIYLFYILVYVVAGTLFLVWVNRSNKNLHAIGMTDMQFSPGWAVGWWFVPFINLVRGHTIVKELWEGSDSPSLQVSDAKKAPQLLDFWWGAWLISGLLARISGRMVNGDSPSLDDFQNSAYLGIAGSLVSLVAGYLVIRIVSAISEAQSNKRRQIRRDAHASAPAPPAQDIEPPAI